MSAESDFVAALRVLATDPAARGLADDCAVLALGSETLVLTHDSMAQDVHFLPDQDPADIAWKLVATNLSDLAAKGAQPLGVLLSYQLGHGEARFVEGLREVLDHYACPLLGGDTVRGAGPRVLGLTAIGRATCDPVPSRGGAQPGHGIWITGPVGAAMMGLENLRAGTGDSRAYRRPAALLAEGRALAPHVSAMMDVSDGLLLDASRLARASGVTLALESGAVPLACPEPRRAEALRWGDDYQLLFTLAPGTEPATRAFQIGTVRPTAGHPLMLDGVGLSEEDGLGYQH